MSVRLLDLTLLPILVYVCDASLLLELCLAPRLGGGGG